MPTILGQTSVKDLNLGVNPVALTIVGTLVPLALTNSSGTVLATAGNMYAGNAYTFNVPGTNQPLVLPVGVQIVSASVDIGTNVDATTIVPNTNTYTVTVGPSASTVVATLFAAQTAALLVAAKPDVVPHALTKVTATGAANTADSRVYITTNVTTTSSNASFRIVLRVV